MISNTYRKQRKNFLFQYLKNTVGIITCHRTLAMVRLMPLHLKTSGYDRIITGRTLENGAILQNGRHQEAPSKGAPGTTLGFKSRASPLSNRMGLHGSRAQARHRNRPGKKLQSMGFFSSTNTSNAALSTSATPEPCPFQRP